jgi:hypothetical protein
MNIFSNKRDQQGRHDKTNIKTGGGAFIGGSASISGDGNTVLGKNSGDLTSTYREPGENSQNELDKLLVSLRQQINSLPETTPQEQKLKDKAEKARAKFEQEVIAVKDNPKHEPDEITMDGLIAAFKQIGNPVLSTALNIMGLPFLAHAFNLFTESLPDKKE